MSNYYLSSTVAMLPMPPSRAPLLSLLEMYVRSSGSASDGRLLSISVRLWARQKVRMDTTSHLEAIQVNGEQMEKADDH